MKEKIREIIKNNKIIDSESFEMMNKKIDIKKERTAHLRLGNVNCLTFYSVDGLGYIRLFGVGLHWKDTSRHRMYFSERNGYKKALKIGSWRISFLLCR
jgi:hypothetical protein